MGAFGLVSTFVVILLVGAIAHILLFGGVFYLVFRDDIHEMLRPKKKPSMPTCMYCESKWTHPVGEGQTRWEGDDELVLVTTYECEHCRLPFWHVERVRVGTLKH